MSRILLIEDDYKLLRTRTQLLQSAGYEVYPAAAYYAALDMIRLYGQFSLCISNIEVGGYDPMLLMRDLSHVRERHHTPMLLLTKKIVLYRPVCDVLRLACVEEPCSNETLLEHIRHLIPTDVPQDRVS